MASSPLSECAQFCAHHQSLRCSIDNDAAADNAFVARNLSHFVDAHRTSCKLLILRAERLRRQTLYPTELRARDYLDSKTVEAFDGNVLIPSPPVRGCGESHFGSEFAPRDTLAQVVAARLGDASLQCLFPDVGVFGRVRSVHEIDGQNSFKLVVS
jgi:hypothetical protein